MLFLNPPPSPRAPVLSADGNRQFIQRRYNAFLTMHKELKKEFQEIAAFNFPTKAFLRGASTTKEYRREQFDQYVQLLTKIIQSNPKKEVRVVGGGEREGRAQGCKLLAS